MRGSLTFPPYEAPSSGAQALIGYTIDLSAQDGSAELQLELRPDHLNRNGTLHGGIHAMMLDAAAGFAASRHLSGGEPVITPVVTVTLTTSFLSPIGGGSARAVGRVSGGGYKIVYADAQIFDADGRLCSKASGVFRRAPGA